MNIEQIREYCLTFNDVTEEFPFDNVSLVFKVAGKMFILLPLDAEEPSVSVKCDPELAIELRERYPAIQPAYHFNKKYWNTIFLWGNFSDDQIKGWIKHSYLEVVKKLPKQIRETLTSKTFR